MSVRLRFLFLPTIALFAFELMLVWHPFDVRATTYKTDWLSNKPAGQIVHGFNLSQTLPAGLIRLSRPRKKSVHWHGPHSLRTLVTPNCFSVRFATYTRKNSGYLLVIWQQGSTKQSWQVAAADLVDNDYVDFCPRDGLDRNRDSRISIDGIDSAPGQAATAWLTKSKLAPALVNGGHIGNRSLALQLAYLHHIGPKDIASLGRGAFLLSCLCSLSIGLLVLAATWRELVGAGTLFRADT
jgi:hypothetical protein